MGWLGRWCYNRTDWTDDLVGLVIVSLGVASLIWLLVGCGPATTSEADVRHHCAQRMYGARNDLAAKVLFDSCLARYGHTP